MKHLYVLFILAAVGASCQVPCENGYAGIYPCENVNLLAAIPSSQLGGATTNEVWGWTDPVEGTEYVLLGMSTGIGFFDISNPVQPIFLGTLPGYAANSLWRTMRTHADFLFVCSEASGHGMQIFDLTKLTTVTNPPQTFTEDAHYSGFSNCHTLTICDGFAYACGTNTYSGGLHIVDIHNPLDPFLAGGYDLNGYTHEAQVLIYTGPDEDYYNHTVAICFNGQVESPLTIVDVTVPDDASTISLSDYPAQGYCHQGWLTADGGYMLMDDELDEYYDYADSLHTHIWDMHDLDEPIYEGFYVAGTGIDHNQYVIGNLDYQSNYTTGFNMLDVTDIASSQIDRVGYFDHTPSTNADVFQGEWMNYPYFASGVIPVTDIYQGLFLLQPDFIRIPPIDAVCSSDTAELVVIVENGFVGPYEVVVNGLPSGVTASLVGVSNDSLIIALVSINAASGNYNLNVAVSGAFNSYAENLSLTIESPSIWYLDTDQDGFGDSTQTVLTCAVPNNYSLIAGDCNDLSGTIFPGALGTHLLQDSDCNGIIEDDELPLCSDLNNDQLVTVLDIQLLMANYNCAGNNCIGDLDLDGSVSVLDLSILLSDFGEFCP